MEKLLDSSLRERRFSSSPYKVRSSKDERVGFVTDDGERLFREPIPLKSLAARASEKRWEGEWLEVEKEIEAAKFVLEIQDDSSSDEFVPYSQETLSRATNFLRRLVLHANAANLISMGLPQIGPADHGSIDLYWEKSDRTLLINFPAAEKVASFYGKKAKSEISGRFDPSEGRAELVLWLAD